MCLPQLLGTATARCRGRGFCHCPAETAQGMAGKDTKKATTPASYHSERVADITIAADRALTGQGEGGGGGVGASMYTWLVRRTTNAQLSPLALQPMINVCTLQIQMLALPFQVSRGIKHRFGANQEARGSQRCRGHGKLSP